MSPQRPRKKYGVLTWFLIALAVVVVAWLATQNRQISGTDSGATVSPPAQEPISGN